MTIEAEKFSGQRLCSIKQMVLNVPEERICAQGVREWKGQGQMSYPRRAPQVATKPWVLAPRTPGHSPLPLLPLLCTALDHSSWHFRVLGSAPARPCPATASQGAGFTHHSLSVPRAPPSIWHMAGPDVCCGDEYNLKLRHGATAPGRGGLTAQSGYVTQQTWWRLTNGRMTTYQTQETEAGAALTPSLKPFQHLPTDSSRIIPQGSLQRNRVWYH